MSLNDAGMTAVLIRWQGDVREVERTAVTMIFAYSALLYGAFFVTAPLAADALRIPDASGVLRLLALTVVIDATAAVPTALLTRAFAQGRRAVADTTSLAVWAGLSIWMAVAGFGVWSLVWGRLIGNLVAASVVFVLAPRRPAPGFDRKTARRLAVDGLPLTGSSFLTFCMVNVDTAVVGRVLGPVALGYYALAFNLSSWPVHMFSFAVRRVSLAGFAQMRADPTRLHHAFARALALLTAVTVPVCIVLAVLGGPAVETVYGTKWLAATDALTFLALLSIVRVNIEITDDLLVALGKGRSMMRIQFLWLMMVIPALVVGARLGGLRGAALAQFLVAVGIVVPVFALRLHTLGFPLVRLAARLVRPALGGVLFAALAQIGLRADAGPAVRLLLGAGVALVGYAAAVAPMRRLIHDTGLRRRGRDSHRTRPNPVPPRQPGPPLEKTAAPRQR
jgi:PST family polysaccharide transporter